ncbi:MAG: sulfatase-like hydrolase/transferase, partial [Deltaproteobacteria bacterium]|nr:sulfatase-like hydrolase/transferase [Deltaproteobacteria bacterium]
MGGELVDVLRAALKREATRYYFLVVILLVTCPCAALAQQPNVLFIAIDDLNDWPLGGHAETLSPNIDRLAAEGMVFLNAQTASPACNPSRVAVLTGISPETSGI